MSEQNNPDGKLIEGHEYDGIQELDHPLPRWWLNLFYGTIIFSVIYVGYYELFGGPTQIEQFKTSLAKIKSVQSQVQSNDPGVSEDVDVNALIADPNAMKVGAETFQQVCAVCHASKGEGLIGPNLTDKYWIHSKGDFGGIMTAVLEGFPDKGMPAWKDVIAPEKRAPLAAYVVSLKGTNPPNAKAPQGELVE